MNDDDLRAQAEQLEKEAAGLNHPLIPAGAKRAIQRAALIVSVLAKREADRCQRQKTSGSL